jgi:hypothetical protein
MRDMLKLVKSRKFILPMHLVSNINEHPLWVGLRAHGSPIHTSLIQKSF